MRNALYFSIMSIASATISFAQGPNILSVLGAGDYSDAASVGIPRGSIFVIEGSGLAASNASATTLPLPTSLNSVTVRIWDSPTGGNLLTVCPLWYVSPVQVNAILPSPLAAGQYYVSTVVAGFETGRLPIIATNGRFTPFAQGAVGFGPAIVQEYDSSGGPFLNKPTAAAHPGSVLVLWGTGLGPLSSGSDVGASPPATIRSDVTVYVDGQPATPFYAGRASTLPGVDQINFVLPSSVKPRCFVPLQVTTANTAGAVNTIAVSLASSACPSEFNLPASTLATLDAGGVVKAAVLRMTSTTSQSTGAVQQAAGAWVAEYNLNYLSVFALGTNATLVSGTAICSRSPVDHGYGQNASATLPVPVITGASGCTWTFAANGAVLTGSPSLSCVASSFAFTGSLSSVNGTFPPPRPSSAISSLASHRSPQALTVSWNANPGATDTVALTIGSSYTPVTLFGSSQTKNALASCQMSPVASPFTFSPTDVAWAMQYANPNPVAMQLATTSDRVFPGNNQIDFVLVRSVNSVEATTLMNWPLTVILADLQPGAYTDAGNPPRAMVRLPHIVAYGPPSEAIETVHIVAISFDNQPGMAGSAAIT